MTWSGRNKRATPAQLSQAWAAELLEAAQAAETVRIACSPEDHAGLRQAALRIAEAEGREVAVDVTLPRMVVVRFTVAPAG